mgnify:CR=1 FL=1
MRTSSKGFIPYYDENGDLQYRPAPEEKEPPAPVVKVNLKAILTPALNTAIEYATKYGTKAAIQEYGDLTGMRLVATDGTDFGSMTIGDILKKCK